MEDLFNLHSSNSTGVKNSHADHNPFGSETEVAGSEIMSDLIKAQIINHPLYPTLVSANLECRKVGAPPETASVMEEISKESIPIGGGCEIGADPELDDFMEAYCEILHAYKEELSKPFDEATTFLSDIESQLSSLCKETLMTAERATSFTSDEGTGGTSEEEVSCTEMEAAGSYESSSVSTGTQELKETLMRKYSGYLSSLKKDFLKKRKKGQLPKDARNALLDWWNNHYRWPYPTKPLRALAATIWSKLVDAGSSQIGIKEEEKTKLSEITGLDQKQINNWFINQRKRHWRPSEDMRFALMEGMIGGSSGGSVYFDTAGATGIVDVRNDN